MIFTETKIAGCFIVELEKRSDVRGFFARQYCRDEFSDHGIDPTVAQVNVGRSLLAGTLRGMHFQVAPFADTKLVSCTAGAVYDVCLDLRSSSATYGQWVALELTADAGNMLFLPEGTAHGYQTLRDNSQIMYSTNARYSQGHSTGVRYNDPSFGIDWPVAVSSISDADKEWPQFELAD